MNTRGLMELIVLNVGLDLGVISPTLFTMMVLMALATTMATAPILQRLVPTAVAQASTGCLPGGQIVFCTFVLFSRRRRKRTLVQKTRSDPQAVAKDIRARCL